MAWPPTTHQDVEDDLTDGHGWATSLIQRFGVSEQTLPTPLIWKTGQYYTSAVNALAAATGAQAANRLYLTPVYFPTGRTVNQIGVQVTTAGTATHVARLGIYNSSTSTGLPTTVLVDAGTVAVDSTGSKTLTISSTLTGLVWLASTSQSGSFTTLAAGALPPMYGASILNGALPSSLTRDSTVPTSALPDLSGDATVVGGVANVVPRILVRAA